MNQFKLLEKKTFAPLFWTQFLGAFNDNFLKNALVILATYKITSLMGIPSQQLVVASGAIFILPFFLFSATAGQLADKYEKSKIIRIVKVAEIGIMVLSAVALLIPRYEILMLTLFLMGLHSTFFGPVKYSILPQHLAEDELVGGNAIIEAGTFLAILLGTIAGGVLISLGDSGAWLVSGALLVVALLGYFTSRAIPPAPATDPKIEIEWNPIFPTWKIIKLAKINRSVFLSIMGISWFWFFGGAMLTLFPHYCKDTLRGSEGVVTLFLAIFSIGTGVGSLLCERLSRKRLEIGLVPIGSIGITLFTLDLFRIGTPAFEQAMMGVRDMLTNPVGINICVDLLLLSVFSGFFIVPLYTLVQERSDNVYRSRIIAANNILNAMFMVVASGVLFVLILLGLTIPQIFLFMAILNGLVAIYIYTVVPEFLYRFICWIIANILYRMKVEGDDNLPKDGAALLVCNHVSFVDWLVVAAAIKRPVHFVMDHAFASNWLARRILKRGKVILIASAKENPALLEAAFDQIAHDLEAGEIVCIFPEGRITKTGLVNSFRPGVEKILARTPVPVFPMALIGLWGSFFSREGGGQAIKKMPKRFWSRVTLKIGNEIAPSSASAKSLEAAVCALGDFCLAEEPRKTQD